jgi:hypothetical protein
MTSTTHIYEHRDGAKIECRLDADRTLASRVVHIQCRQLRKDGRPHDDRWYPMSDWLLLRLQELGSDIVRELHDEARELIGL